MPSERHPRSEKSGCAAADTAAAVVDDDDDDDDHDDDDHDDDDEAFLFFDNDISSNFLNRLGSNQLTIICIIMKINSTQSMLKWIRVYYQVGRKAFSIGISKVFSKTLVDLGNTWVTLAIVYIYWLISDQAEGIW